MEDWQIDAACYAAGMCSNGVDSVLSRIEEALESGEIDLSEAELIHNDLFNIKGKRMKPKNLLTTIINDKKTELEKKLLYKASINALTSATASNILLHLAQMRRNDQFGLTELGAIPSHNGEPTLDERNAADLANAGDDYNASLTTAAGHEEQVRPLAIAEVCDGIRNTLYEEFEGIVDLEPPAALYRNTKNVRDRINYDQPMSLEFNLAFRVRMAGVIDENRAQRVAKEDNVEVDFIREVMKKDSERLAKNLLTVAPEVIREAEGFNTTFTPDDFTSLPVDTQLRIGNKIASTLNNEYQRLYGVKIRSGNLEVANQCTVLKATWEEVKSWINETESNFAKETQSRTARS